ncbi:NUDIX hydrolase N-terminal domain-containing protein [Haloplasma contractile]|uniref:MutT protein n=1 Tax=Haloplasma contractile SSD-17B TaxID=1033810 RepID=U2E6N6_9MOLU|nr:NUDIX hydrolase N-terminal domain-containing protein [Haloplasma contractile]ERJ10888.1 MutT protein [Haloplasma contractile SSD-17B]
MDEYLEFIKKVQAISQIGLSYSEDEYAVDNYKELKALSTNMLSKYTGIPHVDADLYQTVMYPTPQTATRTMVINDEDEILFVKEKDSQKWSLPGGWCDVDHSPKESAIKEVREESGYLIEIERLVAITDRKKYLKTRLYDIYYLIFSARVIGGEPRCNHETLDIKWFRIDQVPELSTKTTKEELMIAYHVYKHNRPVYVD